MKSTKLRLGVAALSSCLAFAACGDDDDDGSPGSAGQSSDGGVPGVMGGSHTGGSGQGGAGETDGSLKCEVLGELCHAADTGSGSAHDCHELGHEADPVACEQQFASCINGCVEHEGAAGAGGAESTGQDPHCVALGELCHPVDDGDGPLHDCHELGHESDPAVCRAAFDECSSACLAALELIEEGAGGAGGAAAGGAGGAAVGGAGEGAGGVGGVQ